MKTKLLLQHLENELWRGLNKRYAGHSPELSFQKDLPRESPLSRVNFFTLHIQEKPKYLGQTRLPQSRFFVTEAIYSRLRLRTVSFFDNHLIIVEPISSEKLIQLDVQINRAIQFVASHKAKKHKNEHLSFEIYQPLILWLSKDQINQELDHLPQIFRAALDREYKRHPISCLKSGDWNLLRKIDVMWAEILDLNGRIASGNGYLFWLQEIYIHFGWHSQLYDFHKRYEVPIQSDSGKLLQKRWQSVRDKMSWKANKLLPQFLNHYLSGSINLLQVQDSWKEIHYPAYRISAVSAIAAEPQKYIALGLLAIQYGFVWADRYSELVLKALPGELRPLIRFLFLLKKQSSFFHFGSHWSYAASVNGKTNQKLILQSESIELSQVHQRTKQVSQVTFDEKFYFKIDKPVKVRTGPEANHLAIHPSFLQPVQHQPALKQVLISYDEWLMNIPLAWNRFQVECNRARLKFIRKKNRYQVRVSHVHPEKKLEVDGQRIETKTSGDAQLYLDIIKQDSQMVIKAVNSWGQRPSVSQGIYFSGWAVDIFGNLHQHLNLASVTGNGSKPIDLLAGLEQNPIQISSENKPTFNGRFLTGQQIDIKFLNGPLSAFLYTLPDILRHKTFVFTDESPGPIAQTFYEALKFYPWIRGLSAVKETLFGFVFLVTESYEQFQVSVTDGIQVIPLEQHTNQNAFLVHPHSLKAVLSSRLQPK